MDNPSTADAPPARRKSSCFLFGCGCCLMMILTVVFLIAAGTFLFYGLPDSVSGKYDGFIIKTAVAGFPAGKEKQIAVIPVHGVIQYGNPYSSGGTDPELFSAMLEKAEADPGIAAVIISIDSPGGEVNAADEIYRRILSFKERTKLPVYALMRSVAASGGYYVAAACDKIFAGEMTLTGSIGVIISSYNFTDLLDLVGISAEVYKSGKMKDMLNPARERTAEEAKIVQELVGECYDVFARIVAESRKLPLSAVKSSPIGDGRVYHGRKALEYGLVDHLGFLPDAVAFCEKSAGAEKGSFSVVQYEFNISFLNLLFSAESPVLRGINVKLPLPESQSAVLKPGRLYYLPGGM